MEMKKYKFVGKLSLILLSIILTFVALEIVVRWNEKIFITTKYQEPSNLKDIYDEVSLRKKIEKNGITSTTFNIYYFGASTMYGEPYINTIPVLVEKMLQGKIDGKELKWINIGIPGIDFNEVNRRIKQIVEQKNIYFPSLVIIYSGHNEFLYYQDSVGFAFENNKSKPIDWIMSKSRLVYRIAKTLKLYKLEIDDRKFFDVPVVPIEKKNEILNNYENKMLSTISYLKNNGVPTIISTVVGNYADFEPNRSVFSGDESKKEEFKNDMDMGLEAFGEGKMEKALSDYKKALEIDKDFAETNYQIGQVYQKLGENEKAWKAYLKAVDNDGLPIRGMSTQNSFIREINEDAKTKVVDTVNYFKQKSENGLIGNNLIIDAQHPNLKGYFLISELFAKKIINMYPEKTTFVSLPFEEIDKIFNTNEGLYRLYHSRADWMVRLSTWRWDYSQRLKVAEDYLDKADTIYENTASVYLTRMVIAYIRKDVPEAKRYFEMAQRIDPKYAREYLREPWINQIIRRALD